MCVCNEKFYRYEYFEQVCMLETAKEEFFGSSIRHFVTFMAYT